jgi:thioredoxin reductase
MTVRPTVAIVGAGPYGLSIAAHLRATGTPFRIFGTAMQTWGEHMPDGMHLKSDGFASNLSDPASTFTLRRFCESTGRAYHDTGLATPVETMRAYGLAFQQRMVPGLEETQVLAIEPSEEGFRLGLDDGRSATARRVVLAVGISHFPAMPTTLARLPADLVSHSADHKDVQRFRGRSVVVIGAGASAIDLAVLLAEAGARATLVARREALRFLGPPTARSLWERLQAPGSTIGPGWRSFFYANAPGVFRLLPESLRWRIVNGALSPAAGWSMKDRFDGRVRVLLRHHLESAEVEAERVRLLLRGPQGRVEESADHVIAATGYRVDLRRLTLLGDALRSDIRTHQHVPVLSRHFESSVRGLYFVGMASKYTFGPVMQFACGARWTARRITPHLARAESGAPGHAGTTGQTLANVEGR